MDAQLKAEIQAEIAQLAANAPALMTRAVTEKLYEVFILACLARALRNLGATLVAKDSTDAPTNDLEFRFGPGRIYAPDSTPGFIHVTYRNNEYEIQNSLRVLGPSKVLHELDVCLIDRDEAVRCRRDQVEPSYTKVRMFAECKCYGRGLRLHLGREFLGLSREFGLRCKFMVSNVGSRSVKRLVNQYRGTCNFRVSPLIPGSVDEFVDWLSTELRQVLP